MMLQTQLAVALLLALSTGVFAARHHAPGHHKRHLLHSQQPLVPPCVYHNVSENYWGLNIPACAPNDAYTTELTHAQLNTPAARVYAAWRGAVQACLVHTNESSCSDDTTNYCAYNTTTATCGPSTNLKAYLFSCPGMFTQAYFQCRILGDTQGAAGCPSGPACYWDTEFASPDGNSCYVYDILAENDSPALLADWIASDLLNFLNPDASGQLYGTCAASLAYQQAEAYSQTCTATLDSPTCLALDCRVINPAGNSTCTAVPWKYDQILVGGAPAQLVYKQMALCPVLNDKPKSCAKFQILYSDGTIDR